MNDSNVEDSKAPFTDEEWVAYVKKFTDTLETTVKHTPQSARDSLVSGSAVIAVESAQDGRTTVVTMVMDGDPIAEGRALRRSGDTRDRELGLALATMRAFQSLVEREKKFLKSKGYEE